MKIVQCENNHFYDSEKYSSCPYCEAKSKSNEDYENTISIYNKNDEDLTVQLDIEEVSTKCVTGWLVCLTGNKRGASYVLHDGRNFIGRALDMDICFSEDTSVSRVKHCSVIYDDKNKDFYVISENGIVILDDKVVTEPTILKEDMVLTIGENSYCFVPYCNGKRGWDD